MWIICWACFHGNLLSKHVALIRPTKLWPIMTACKYCKNISYEAKLPFSDAKEETIIKKIFFCKKLLSLPRLPNKCAQLHPCEENGAVSQAGEDTFSIGFNESSSRVESVSTVQDEVAVAEAWQQVLIPWGHSYRNEPTEGWVKEGENYTW